MKPTPRMYLVTYWDSQRSEEHKREVRAYTAEDAYFQVHMEIRSYDYYHISKVEPLP